MELKINEKLKVLIPPLSTDEYEQLEQNILHDGIREPISIWNGVIIDGHNRYEICKRNNIAFQTVEIIFPDEGQAEEWIMKNQLGRRNLSDVTRGRLVLKLKDTIAARAKLNQGKRTDLCQMSEECRNGNILPKLAESCDTRKELAKLAGLSHGTISKIEKVDRTAPEPVKQAMGKEISIDKAYQINKQVQQFPVKERESEADRLLEQEYRNMCSQPNAEWKIYDKLRILLMTPFKMREYITEENTDIYLRRSATQTPQDVANDIDDSIEQLEILKKLFLDKNCFRRIK